MNNIYPDITLSKGCVQLDQSDKVFGPVGLICDISDRSYGIVIKSNNRKINKLLRKVTFPEKEAYIVVFFTRNSSSSDIWYKNKPCVIVPNNGILGTMIVPRADLKKYADNRKRKERELADELKSSQREQRIYR